MDFLIVRFRMIILGLIVLIVGVFNPTMVMRIIGEVLGDAEEYDPIRIRKRHRKEFLTKYARK